MDNAELLALIKEALAEVAPTRKKDFADATLDTKIESLGLDSIATMEMVGFLEEQVDATFPDEKLTEVTSLRDLGALVTAHKG